MQKKYPEQSPNSIPDMKSEFPILEFYSKLPRNNLVNNLILRKCYKFMNL